MVANEEHARKLEMEYKEMQCEADRAQAKKEVRLAAVHNMLAIVANRLMSKEEFLP